jgi:hypothetical protein
MNTESSPGRTIGALVLIGLGTLFLIGQVFDIGNILGALWPFFIILPGAAFLYAAYKGGKHEAGLAMPGAIIGGTGLILLYQNMTNHWESWAYAWSLYPLFVGLALTFMGRRTGNQGTYRTGQGFVRYSGIAFISLAALFELFIFNEGGFLGNIVVPLVLIAAGVFLLSQRRTRGMHEKPKNDIAFTGPAVVGTRARNGSGALMGDRLRREIDAALAEDDPPKA